MKNLTQALRRLAKAVVVITSEREGVRYAMSATAVCELSFDPPSMLVCVNRSTSLYPILAARAPFAINILHHSQLDVATACAGAVKGEERFAQGTWHAHAGGTPMLANAQATIVCRNERQVDYGTHGIFIGGVIDVTLDGVPEPLVYIDGRFTRTYDAASVAG